MNRDLISFKVFQVLAATCLAACQFGAFTGAANAAGTCKIVKVTKRIIPAEDQGRTPGDLGYQFLYVDKFYRSGRAAPEGRQGEVHTVAWRCRNVPRSGEEITLVFDYRTTNEIKPKKKELKLFINRGGLYETPVEHFGDNFEREGPVDSWKVSIIRGGALADTRVSTLWRD